MKKILLLSMLALVSYSCKSTQNPADDKDPVVYAESITAADLSDYLNVLASDEFEGRETGTPGQKKAAEFLKNFYSSLNIKGGDIRDNSPYFQSIPSSFYNDRFGDSENVIAIIEGEEIPDEYIVISAHYDHLGVRNGKIYNGADDDGSGTVAVMEIAEAFKKAALKGHRPKRSIIFLHFTGEEKGLLGSKYYTENPIYALDKTIANLNIDMIGRRDDAHKNNPDYVYLIGSDRLSSELHQISEDANTTYTNLDLDYKYNAEDDPNRFYYRSDHYNFAKFDIPVIFYFNGVHADYHMPTDTVDKIEYDILEKRTKLVFYTAWELVNRKEKPFVDKPTIEE
ncbi:M28 family metallopeptidase [Psychroflexus halocasei]|uniref:Peptidase family M28 n=1 Tax=Psychroflexus halocasei TaxID=908615 RepID=A0A1H3YS78_9FLAO|nr:M28 family metallopeptidase [Psychroflexus halocasei]SEA13902.1 Peptidase family M28 [Psychroflexus halocasei]